MWLKKKKSKNATTIYNCGDYLFGNVEVPSILKRLVKIPNTAESKISFIRKYYTK